MIKGIWAVHAGEFGVDGEVRGNRNPANACWYMTCMAMAPGLSCVLGKCVANTSCVGQLRSAKEHQHKAQAWSLVVSDTKAKGVWRMVRKY